MAEKKVKTPLSEELRRYGYVFEMKKSMLMYLAAAGTAVALGCFFSLGAVEIAVLGIWIGAFLPFFVRNAYKNKYEQQRFSDAGYLYGTILVFVSKIGKSACDAGRHDAAVRGRANERGCRKSQRVYSAYVSRRTGGTAGIKNHRR